MKYLRHYYLQSDNTNTFVFFTNVPPMGRKLPDISSLNVICNTKDPNYVDYCYSTCNDDEDLSAFAEPGLIVISYEQWIGEIVESYNFYKNYILSRLYNFASNNKVPLVGEWFIYPEVAVFSYKKLEADAAIAAATDADANLAAPNLKIEADIRGITTKQLATIIIEKFSNYMRHESKVSGLRGKIAAELGSYTLNASSVENIKTSFTQLSTYDWETQFTDLLNQP